MMHGPCAGNRYKCKTAWPVSADALISGSLFILSSYLRISNHCTSGQRKELKTSGAREPGPAAIFLQALQTKRTDQSNYAGTGCFMSINQLHINVSITERKQ